MTPDRLTTFAISPFTGETDKEAFFSLSRLTGKRNREAVEGAQKAVA